MQSTENVKVTESNDKSLTEWPTLSDVCSNVKKPSLSPVVVKNGRNSKKMNKTPSETSGGYDSSKENEISPQSTNGRGARKKTSARTKWVPVPIVPQPYKKRGNGRYFHDSRNGYYDRKNENGESTSGQENGRGSVRGNNRFRGKRGRGYSHSWRPRRDETSRGEPENGSPDLTFDPKLFYQNTVYYDPFIHSMYASALRDKELKKAIRQQIEYYFSDDNLVKDIFIRRKMDSQGYVPLTLISTFHRVKNLTESMDTIIESLKDSSKLELADNAKVRPVIDPLKWPLPDNFIGLRTDVPEFFPGRPYVNSLVEGIDNLNLTDANGDSFPQSPDSVSLSPDQACDFFTDVNGEQNISGMPFYPESVSPKDITDDLNYYTDSSVDPYVTNGIDYYSQTPSPVDHSFDQYYSEQIPNGVIYYTANINTDDHVGNGDSFYYGSSPDEVLSAATDNSVENQQEVDKLLEGSKSPEPPR